MGLFPPEPGLAWGPASGSGLRLKSLCQVWAQAYWAACALLPLGPLSLPLEQVRAGLLGGEIPRGVVLSHRGRG